MTEISTLVCPKCQAAMRTYERSGLLIDQCTDCRGIFLDHGELQRLIAAEGAAPAEGSVSGRDEPVDMDSWHRKKEYDPERRDSGDSENGAERAGAVRHEESRGRRGDGEPRRRESRFGGLMDLFGGE
jgi:uncharacterized protein